MLIAGQSSVDDLLRPGISEWGLLRSDGSNEVRPIASVIAGGEGDLRRADAPEIQQSLLPIEVQFQSSENWTQQNQIAGSSRLGLVLLALLGLLLGGEQALAYWASYHTRSEPLGSSEPTASLHRHTFGLGSSPVGGRHS